MSTGERITHETFDALTSRPVVTDDTLSPGAANKTIALRYAFVVLALRETDHASTPRGVLVGLAIRVRTAGYIVARINAAALDARQIILAIVVDGTLALAGRNSRTAGAVRIADHTSGTLAHVISLGVNAIRAVAARIVRALVHVDAAVLRIALEASLAHASRRIARRAFRVNAAWETVARILA